MNKFKQYLKTVIKAISGYELQGVGGGSFALVRDNVDMNFLYPSTLHLMEKTDDEVEGTWKLYEHLCQLRVKTILDKYDIDLVVDVGANEGQFAADLRQHGYQGKIISFEPISSAFAILQETAAADRNWEVKNLALGTQNTEQTIYVSDDSAFTSFLKSNDWCEREFGEESIAT